MFGIGRSIKLGVLYPIGRMSILLNTTTIPASSSNTCRRSITQSCSVHGEVRSTDLVALEYADLNLKHTIDIQKVPACVPEWNKVFKDPTLPLMVDIGSGSGRFLIWHAKRSPETRNYLGLEIRQKLVQRAQVWVEELALDNIYFVFANATVSFEQLVSTYPGPLVFVSILCPDPHFKKRHHKRRVVQTPLVNCILQSLSPRGQVFVQSDVLDVALDMRDQFDAHLVDKLEHIDHLCDHHGWLLKNPMGVRTEREIHAELQGAKIYRRMYHKTQNSS